MPIYVKISLIIPCIALLLVQCTVLRSVNESTITRDLVEFKLFTEYIICKNYHQGFEKIMVWDSHRARKTDSLLSKFMFDKSIYVLYIKPDKTIEYLFNYVYLFGNRKFLIFDFSGTMREMNGIVKIEEGIYYRH